MTRTATRDPVTDHWSATDGQRPVEFLHLCGAFGWGDPAEEGDLNLNAVVVVGLQADQALVVLEESLGTIEEVGVAAVGFKDRLDLERYFLDPEPNDYRKRLMRVDGLTSYATTGRDALDRLKYVRPPEFWPHFRGRECLASLVPVRQSVLADYESYVTRITTLTNDAKLLIADWCPKARLLNRETFGRGRNHPLMKALVFAISGMLWMLEEPHSTGERVTNNWYGNIK